MEVGSRLDKVAKHRVVSKRDREHRRRAAVFRLRIYVGIGFDQHPDHRRQALGDSQMEGSPPALPAYVRIGVFCKECLDNSSLALPSRHQ